MAHTVAGAQRVEVVLPKWSWGGREASDNTGSVFAGPRPGDLMRL